MSHFTMAACCQDLVSDILVESSTVLLNQEVIIKEMQPSDREQLENLLIKCADISAQTGIYVDDLSFYLSRRSDYLVYVCKDKKHSNLCAFLIAEKCWHHIYIKALGVDKDYRRFGIATKLLKRIYDFAQGNSYEYLSIFASNNAAKKCYEKFGFTLDGSKGSLIVYLDNKINSPFAD